MLTLKDQLTGKGFKMENLGKYNMSDMLDLAKAEQDRRNAAGIAPVMVNKDNQVLRGLAKTLLATRNTEESILRKSIVE